MEGRAVSAVFHLLPQEMPVIILVGLGERDFPQNRAILILFTHVFPLKATLGLFLRWTCSDSTFATTTPS